MKKQVQNPESGLLLFITTHNKTYKKHFILSPMWEDIFCVFFRENRYFASILRMAEFRHPIFGRLADFPYIKIGTL